MAGIVRFAGIVVLLFFGTESGGNCGILGSIRTNK